MYSPVLTSTQSLHTSPVLLVAPRLAIHRTNNRLYKQEYQLDTRYCTVFHELLTKATQVPPKPFIMSALRKGQCIIFLLRKHQLLAFHSRHHLSCLGGREGPIPLAQCCPYSAEKSRLSPHPTSCGSTPGLLMFAEL